MTRLIFIFFTGGVIMALLGCTPAYLKIPSKLCPNCERLRLSPNSAISIIGIFKPARLPAIKSTEQTLHIYIEGDGMPWKSGTRPANNPNSRSMLAFKLMMQDDASAVYIFRPCYGHSTMPIDCSPDLWTHARYSKTVVEKMNDAIDDIMGRTDATGISLFGHSGGGTLAVLIAATRNDVRKIITIAANLDHRHWTNTKGYLALDKSLNPADMPPLLPKVRRIHFTGGRDSTVSLESTLKGFDHDNDATHKHIEQFDHHCCWEREWKNILQTK